MGAGSYRDRVMARFSVTGIPVQVDPWFFLGLFFVYSWSGGERIGLFAALSLGVLTLIHELGHALVARHHGCAVSIRLNLFVGWASYSAPRPLSAAQRIVISLMGPLAQLGAALVALAFVHGMIQRSTDPRTWWELGMGIAWAGVVIAFLNLLPLWPLDGGHVLHSLLGYVLPAGRALRAVLVWTLVGLGLVVLAGIAARAGDDGIFAAERTRPLDAARRLLEPSLPAALWAQVRAMPAYLLEMPWFLLFFCGLATVQGLSQLSRRETPVMAGIDPSRIDLTGGADRPGPAPDAALGAAVVAERRGWDTGRIVDPPKGFTASPWLRAHLALLAGDDGGVQAALAQVVAPGRRWVLPDVARVELAPLVDRLVDPLPTGAPMYNATLLHVLAHHGPADRLLRYANQLYGMVRDPEILFVAAGGLARRGEAEHAVAWLRRATVERPDAARILGDPAFAGLRHREDFQRLLAGLPSRPS